MTQSHRHLLNKADFTVVKKTARAGVLGFFSNHLVLGQILFNNRKKLIFCINSLKTLCFSVLVIKRPDQPIYMITY